MTGEELKGHLDLLVLTVLAREQLHGYAIIDRLHHLSEGVFDLPEGTVYPVLHRLEKAGLLSSNWTAVSGRRRRTYQLTARGREALVERTDAWSRFSGAVTATLKGAPWPNAI